MRRLSVATMLWFVLLALVLGVLAQLVLADDCTGTHWLCGTWYDTCCARGCSVEYWDPIDFQISCHEVDINVGYVTYTGKCVEYRDTANQYTCPTQEPPCNRTHWWFWPMESCLGNLGRGTVGPPAPPLSRPDRALRGGANAQD